MPSGAARIAEASTIEALRSRTSRRRPVPEGVVGVLTVLFWAVWIYLVMPIMSLLLWAAGIDLFVRQNQSLGYHALGRTVLFYSSVWAALIGLLAIWVFWNVARYGGRLDRRTVKRANVTDFEMWKAFHLDESIGRTLRDARSMRLDLDADGCVVMLADAPPPRPIRRA